ncbi:MAG: hypothetical protein ACMUHY_08640 [Thermoplasmatota archaeon]
MVFEGLKKFFSRTKFEETPNHTMQIINEDIDELEREIQEYLHDTDNRPENKPDVKQPEILSQGGGRVGSSFITPEEEKRITGKEKG